MLNIEERKDYKIAIHHLGFRPFFLGASLFSCLAVIVWFWLFHVDASGVVHSALPATSWHAHEMIFGYTFAVIAGFLLTAVRNWTNVQTLHGTPLILLVLLWLAARIAPFLVFADAIALMALLDLAFNVLFLLAITIPIFKARQWGQMGIILIVTMLCLMNGVFYLGMFERFAGGMQIGISGGLYLCIFLIMLMGRRVIPFFIEKGVEGQVEIVNRRWLDMASLVAMSVFIIFDVFMQQQTLVAMCAVVLFVLQIIRLYDWHVAGIWRKPLLWSLYLAFVFITLGFAMKAVTPLILNIPAITKHAFAYGGIGLMTLSMMSRVTLGHTGRNVFQPPRLLQWLFAIFVSGVIVRVILPIFFGDLYVVFIGVSQILWVLAFAGFVYVFIFQLIRPRVDGRYG